MAKANIVLIDLRPEGRSYNSTRQLLLKSIYLFCAFLILFPPTQARGRQCGTSSGSKKNHKTSIKRAVAKMKNQISKNLSSQLHKLLRNRNPPVLKPNDIQTRSKTVDVDLIIMIAGSFRKQ